MLEVRGIEKSYEGKPLLHDISFRVQPDETVCLLGPSGSGKSTLLLIIAGLEQAEAGSILWDGGDLTSVPPHLRDFGLVFQDYALFPHLDVFDNVAFGLRMKRWAPEEIRQRAAAVLGLVDLASFEHRRVTDLSGGEQQRVALARALAPRPRLLMFDEPLGALDRALREQLLEQLRQILHETRLSAIYVTHDQAEASLIADRVMLLHDGRIVRQGTIADVWAHPGSGWAAEFLGAGKVVDGTVLDRQSHVETPYGVLTVKCMHGHAPGQRIKLLLRSAGGDPGATITGRVQDVAFQQGRFKVTLDNGLFVYMDAAPRKSQKLSAKLQVECLE
jgi:spermidine/putrescine transport system ATP-binding protein